MNRWLLFTSKNVQFENVSFFKVSDEEKYLLFQHGEINGKSAMLSYCMLDARMRIHDNIHSNWAIEVCVWSVTITICSFPYIGISKELDYIRKSAHEVIQIIHHNIKPISMVNMIYCNNGNGYFSPLRHHRIINTWSMSTNEVSQLLWFNFLLQVVFTFERWLIVLLL